MTRSQFYAFDMLVSDGDDLRKLPLSMRKGNLGTGLPDGYLNGITKFLSPASIEGMQSKF